MLGVRSAEGWINRVGTNHIWQSPVVILMYSSRPKVRNELLECGRQSSVEKSHKNSFNIVDC